MMAIEGSNPAAIVDVLKALITGRHHEFDRKFRPTSGQLGEWVRERQNDMLKATVRSDKIVAYPIGGTPPEGYVPLGEYHDRLQKMIEDKN